MHRTDDLIASIYAAMLGEASWQDFLEQLGARLQSEWTTILLHDSLSGRGTVNLASGISEAAAQDYAAHYSRLNPWMWQVARTPLGQGVPGEAIVPASQFRETEYYRDFLRVHGAETSVGLTIEREQGRHFLVSTLSSDTNEARNLDRAATLTALAPHLARAAAFYRRHQLQSLSDGLSDRLLTDMDVALVVVDPLGQIVHTNPAGEAILASGDPLGVNPMGRIKVERGPLRDMITAMRPNPAANGVVEYQDAQFSITALPLGPDQAASVFLGPLTAILITRKMMPSQRLAARYGLTPAEQRAADALIQGLRPREIAAHAGLSVETVRSQLKAVYAKTGASGHAQLIRLATGLATS